MPHVSVSLSLAGHLALGWGWRAQLATGRKEGPPQQGCTNPGAFPEPQSPAWESLAGPRGAGHQGYHPKVRVHVQDRQNPGGPDCLGRAAGRAPPHPRCPGCSQLWADGLEEAGGWVQAWLEGPGQVPGGGV